MEGQIPEQESEGEEGRRTGGGGGSLRISRRRLLRIARTAPLAVLGASACGSETESEMRNVIKRDLPVVMDCWAEPTCGPQEITWQKFMAIADRLWGKFLAGVEDEGERPVEAGVFKQAFDMTAPFVVCNFPGFSDDGGHPETETCCILCGVQAAILASAADANGVLAPVSRQNFVDAWCAVRDDRNAYLERARRIIGRSNAVAHEGFGCG